MTEMIVTVQLNNGETIRFKIDADETRMRNAAANIEKAMESRYIGVEMNDKVTLIPIHNVASVEVSPAPKAVIAYVVQDAKPVD